MSVKIKPRHQVVDDRHAIRSPLGRDGDDAAMWRKSLQIRIGHLQLARKDQPEVFVRHLEQIQNEFNRAKPYDLNGLSGESAEKVTKEVSKAFSALEKTIEEGKSRDVIPVTPYKVECPLLKKMIKSPT